MSRGGVGCCARGAFFDQPIMHWVRSPPYVVLRPCRIGGRSAPFQAARSAGVTSSAAPSSAEELSVEVAGALSVEVAREAASGVDGIDDDGFDSGMVLRRCDGRLVLDPEAAAAAGRGPRRDGFARAGARTGRTPAVARRRRVRERRAAVRAVDKRARLRACSGTRRRATGLRRFRPREPGDGRRALEAADFEAPLFGFTVGLRPAERAFGAVRLGAATVGPTAFFAGLSFCARRARFHALRAAADTLRARLASRLASLRRLRARLSSSLAMRTRCLATSACNLARPSGSAGALDSLPVFFIPPAREVKEDQFHTSSGGFLPRELIHRICA